MLLQCRRSPPRALAKAVISMFWPFWGRSATRPFPMCKQRQNTDLAPPKAISTSYWWVRDEVPEAIKDQLSASLGEAFAALVESGRLEELSMSNPEFLDRAAVTERIDDKMSSIGSMVKAAGLAAQ